MSAEIAIPAPLYRNLNSLASSRVTSNLVTHLQLLSHARILDDTYSLESMAA
jgi:hypothetical protein